MSITVKYGVDSHVLNTVNAPTIGDIQQNSTLKAILGYGDNTRATIHGVEQPSATPVPEGATVVLETRANSKATATAV